MQSHVVNSIKFPCKQSIYHQDSIITAFWTSFGKPWLLASVLQRCTGRSSGNS